MPTRITIKSATIIDHIYYHAGSNHKKDLRLTSGNLWSDLTDHLPNYFLILNEHENTTPTRPYVRLFSDKNIAEFRHKLSTVEWDTLYKYGNINDGYYYFENKIRECFNSSFRPVKLSRKRSKDKNWITPGLKTSSQCKNRLFRKWVSSRSVQDEEKYKNYRRLYNRCRNEAERL